MTKSDEKFAKEIESVIKGFNRRLGKKMCDELNAGCFDCQTRIAIAILNSWVDILRD